MSRKGLAIVAIVLLVIGPLILWPVLRVKHLQHQFALVRVGDDEGTVLRTMGKPWKVTTCGEYSAGNPNECSEEFIYAHPYAPLASQYWVVDFDSGKRVLRSAELQSP
jgi:hypothetical protein